MPKLGSNHITADMDVTAHSVHWPSQSFWYWQSFGLFISALLLLYSFRHWPLDALVIAPYANSHGFMLREAWATAQLGHVWVKQILLLLALGLLASIGLSYWRSAWRDWRLPASFVVLSVILSTGTIGLLKSVSPHSCPWDIQAYGGTDAYFPLFAQINAHTVGGCFPAGHASAGFSLMSFYLLARLAGFRYAYGYWLAAFVLGFCMGWVQMMRGAHFLSHTLWSAWWVWFVEVSFFAVWIGLLHQQNSKFCVPKQMLRILR